MLWYQRLQAVRAGEVRGIVIVLMGAGALLAMAAFASNPGWLGGIVAGLALALSAVFLGLQPLSGQARTAPNVAVGGAILDFSAPDDTGATVELASLRGKPFLLKFFRGHW
jgi:hypothetical protein